MKKIYAVFLSTLLFTSCLNDFLDVDPVSDIATSTFWQTDNDVRAALNSVYADFFDDYEFINCPDGMLFDPVVAQCEWASGEDSEDDYVCLVRNKILGIDVIVFACKPETKEPSCKATYESATIECKKAKKVIDRIPKQ